MDVLPHKDQALLALLEGLRERLGPDTFDVVDHWDLDPYAVGVASRGDHGVLAYISSFGEPAGKCHTELELPASPTDDLPYRVAGRFNDLDLETLTDIVSRHLGLGRTGEL
jgi:hypothetical protein